MQPALLTALALAAALLAAPGHAADEGLRAHWRFDGDLSDATGKTGALLGPTAAFAPGHDGQALDPQWHPLELPDAPDVRLAPGFALDCWVYFDKRPTGYQMLVKKDNEYQLRVDSDLEGGRFAFFVYLDGWEPRVCGPVPEPGRWHHVVARWSGSEISLEVDGELVKSSRAGTPKSTDSPVEVGNCECLLDDLQLHNPVLAQRQLISDLTAGADGDARLSQEHFGGADGWPGWRAAAGGTASVEGGAAVLHADGYASMLCTPALDVDLKGARYVSLDLGCDTARSATLVFATDRGQGTATFPLWDLTRTTVLDMGGNPLWVGRLRFLGLSVLDAGQHTVTLRNLWLGSEPQGRPLMYLRSLAPERAIQRAGREETVAGVVRNLGRAVEGARVTLELPPGVEPVGSMTRVLPRLPYDTTQVLKWQVRASSPCQGTVQARIRLDGQEIASSTRALDFRAPIQGAPASYVPEPKPAHPSLIPLMHYCPLWKLGTHYGWGKIEPWPERRPAIGWYDEGTEEVADWHIKYALEHGIQGFIYCWYRANYGPDVKHSIGHAVDAMMKARYIDKFHFTIMWENGCALGVQSRQDMMDNLFPYWMKTYFKHPSYLKIDNKPVLFVWRPERVAPEVGGSEQVKGMFDDMRAAARKEGFDGLIIIGCVETANRGLLEQMGREGWDASSAYGIIGATTTPPGRDIEGNETRSHLEDLEGQKDIWLGKKEIGAIPDIVDVMMGWDPRPWNNGKSPYYAGACVDDFKIGLRNAHEVINATPGNGLDKRVVVFDNWNEFGEGHYLEPNAGFGFSFLDAIRAEFCTDTAPCDDVVPEDVGLQNPEHVYARYGAVMGMDPRAPRNVAGDLLGWWQFDDDDDAIALDSSAAGFHGIKSGYKTAPGVEDNAFVCDGGSITVASHDLLYPVGGVTVELWANPSAPGESDQWMLNTVGGADTGYRLGMGDGKVTWQIPREAWSHSITAPTALPVGKWSHVVATYDNQTMRLYIDGKEVASGERGGPIRPSGGNLCIGNYGTGNARAFFAGMLDELKLYDRALTPDEVRQHYEEGAARLP
jgi:hypothetical protein